MLLFELCLFKLFSDKVRLCKIKVAKYCQVFPSLVSLGSVEMQSASSEVGRTDGAAIHIHDD